MLATKYLAKQVFYSAAETHAQVNTEKSSMSRPGSVILHLPPPCSKSKFAPDVLMHLIHIDRDGPLLNQTDCYGSCHNSSSQCLASTECYHFKALMFYLM